MLPARPDLPPARPDVIHPPLIPDVYPPPHPEIIYPSRVPPPHRKRERNNLSLHRVHLASLETCISQEQCAAFSSWYLLLTLCGHGVSGYPFNQSLLTMYLWQDTCLISSVFPVKIGFKNHILIVCTVAHVL